MPWCVECDRYLAPPAVNVDGTCPSCGNEVHMPERLKAESTTVEKDLPTIPWHFKLLCAALAIYLGYRFAQMGEWLLHRL